MAELDSLGEPDLVLTAAATLTLNQLRDHRLIVINDSSGIEITLPAASGAYSGMVRFIANKGSASSTVAVTAGFGGAGSGTDTITLAQGDMACVACDGSCWYSLAHTTPG
jgi:hypothetical protein